MDGVEALDEIVRILRDACKNVYITGVNSMISGMLSESREFQQIKTEGRVYKKSSEVLKGLGFAL